MTDVHDRAYGALVGLAAGDASGFPAAYHRLVIAPGRRSLLWKQALELDAQHINKYPLPFSHAAPLASAGFSATDDAEQAALGAEILLDAIAVSGSNEPSIDELFASWKRIVLPQAEHYWGSIADKSAILNTLDELSAPATGSDNPHFYDDSAVPRVVPIGIRFAGAPASAAAVARRLACISNDGVGVDAAAAMAVAIAAGVSGASIQDAVELGAKEIKRDTWLSRKYDLAELIFVEGGSLIDAVPRWNDEVSNLEYNFGNIAAETLPLAFIIAREAHTFANAIGIANLIPKQSDSMPAMVGALLGATQGASAIPASWRNRVEALRGYGVPSTEGVNLQELSARLLS